METAPALSSFLSRATRPFWVAVGRLRRARPGVSWLRVAVTLVAVAAVVMPGGTNAKAAASSLSALSVAGNQLVNGSGQTVRLLGVNVPQLGYTCEVSATNFAHMYQLLSSASEVRAIASWHPNVVRIHLNEDCWLGINGVAVGGAAYRSDIVSYVDELNGAGLYVILDPLITAPGPIMASAENAMADEDHTPAFWSSVATTFRDNHAVVFDLFNEPYLNTQVKPASAAWSCWRDGGCTLTTVAEYTSAGNTTVTYSWQAAGMQQLVDAVRATGATQPLMLSGLQWAYDLSGWLGHLPTDPLHELVADFHLYTHFSCGSYTPCYQSFIPQVAQSHPVVTGEFGDYACDPTFMSEYMGWADTYGLSYVAFGWQTAVNGCQDPYLLAAWSGTPSAYGQPVHDHLVGLSGS